VPLLEVSGLTKVFHAAPTFSQMFRRGLRKTPFPIFKDIHFSLHAGDLYCLTGMNGAGKTTFLKILSGLILPDAGTLRLSGEILPFDHPRLKTTFGLATGEERSFYWRLTGRQNLDFFASFYPSSRREMRRRIQKLTSLLRIEEHLDKFFFTYSTGTKQSLGLCRSLLGDPQILLLDEPTRSLDPQTALTWHAFIRKTLLGEEKKTVLYTTHQLNEAEQFSNRIGILHQGRIALEGDPGTLKKKAGLTENDSLLTVFLKVTKEAPDAP